MQYLEVYCFNALLFVEYCRVSNFYTHILLSRRKKGKHLKEMFDNVMYNAKRLARLIVRGSPGKIFFPDKIEGKNNLQRVLSFSKRMLNNTLKQTVNQTTIEIIDMVKNFPTDMTKNLICITPNIILKIRQMQSENDPEMMERRFLHDLRPKSCKITNF